MQCFYNTIPRSIFHSQDWNSNTAFPRSLLSRRNGRSSQTYHGACFVSAGATVLSLWIRRRFRFPLNSFPFAMEDSIFYRNVENIYLGKSAHFYLYNIMDSSLIKECCLAATLV